MQANKLNVLLDASPLITLCVYRVARQPLIQGLLTYLDITVIDRVAAEVVGDRTTPDAHVARRLIRDGVIQVVPVPTLADVEDFYNSDPADFGTITLAIQRPALLPIFDDKAAFITAVHYDLRPVFLLDLIVLLVKRHGLPAQTALNMVESAAKRFPEGHVAHTMARLEGNRR